MCLNPSVWSVLSSKKIKEKLLLIRSHPGTRWDTITWNWWVPGAQPFPIVCVEDPETSAWAVCFWFHMNVNRYLRAGGSGPRKQIESFPELQYWGARGGNHYCNKVTTKFKIGIKWAMSESPACVLSNNQELGPYSVRVPVRFANKVLLSSGFLLLLLSDSCRNSPHSAVCPLFCSDGPRLPGRQWLPVNCRYPSAFKNHHLDFHILLLSRRLRYILPAWIY